MEITEALFRQYEAVRRSGLANMFDVNRVREIAEAMGFEELADLSIAGYGELLKGYVDAKKRYDPDNV